MRYTITWLPDEDSFRVRREDGEVAYLQAPIFRKLVSHAAKLAKLRTDAMRHPETPIRFECGAPAECAENYQRSLVKRGTEDSRSLHL
jgi:hypothetical protein